MNSQLTSEKRHGLEVLVCGPKCGVHIQRTFVDVADVEKHVVVRALGCSAADVQQVRKLVVGRLFGGRGRRRGVRVRVVGVEEIVPAMK